MGDAHLRELRRTGIHLAGRLRRRRALSSSILTRRLGIAFANGRLEAPDDLADLVQSAESASLLSSAMPHQSSGDPAAMRVVPNLASCQAQGALALVDVIARELDEGGGDHDAVRGLRWQWHCHAGRG